MENWLNTIRNAKKTAVIQDGLLKVHFQIDKSSEMVEEYDRTTKIVLRRAFRTCTDLKGRTNWEVEVGTADLQASSNLEQLSIKESSTQAGVTLSNINLHQEIGWYNVAIDDSFNLLLDTSVVANPILTRSNSKNNLEWRIRNLPYPIEVYSVSVDKEKKCITVRTSNKKYFKQIKVPDLERIGLIPDENSIQFIHKYNTLTITLSKPKPLIEFEKLVRQEVEKLPAKKENNMECNPS